MGSYRNAYPSGGASASAAYHHSGALSHSQRLHELGGGLAVTGSVYGYDNLVADAGYTSVSLALRNNGGGSVNGSTSLLADAGVHPPWRSRSIDPYSQTLLTDSQALGLDVRGLYGQSLYPGVSVSSFGTSAHIHCNTPDAFVHIHTAKPPGSFQASDSVAESRRKTPSLDALIKETWELHSLFRAGLATDFFAGLAAVSKKSKRSGNGIDDIVPRLKRGKQTPGSNDALGKWGDTPLVKEETLSSWKELDAPCKQTRDTSSNNKQKDMSLLLDRKQELYALNLQRFTCERVMEFMGDTSDDHNSDDESLVDSDDDVPNVYAESSHNVKSREEQAYEFFFQMFEENKDLQKLYNEQCHVGKFECLVCSSIPGKPRKKYNGLISVIMHASKIIKTKKKQEHRGYARAVCSALGWDMCRLPTMPLGSSPHPRCCIPDDEEKSTDAEETDEASKENENDKSGGLDSEENSAGEENKSED